MQAEVPVEGVSRDQSSSLCALLLLLSLAHTHAPEPDRAFLFAQTCFHRLKIPAYSSKEIMKQQLLDPIAVKTMDLM
jgi:HECT-domain (ubiquitin-transferase)